MGFVESKPTPCAAFKKNKRPLGCRPGKLGRSVLRPYMTVVRARVTSSAD